MILVNNLYEQTLLKPIKEGANYSSTGNTVCMHYDIEIHDVETIDKRCELDDNISMSPFELR